MAAIFQRRHQKVEKYTVSRGKIEKHRLSIWWYAEWENW